MKATAGCRFNAAKRLEKRDRRMISLSAFTSVYVILLSVLPLFFEVGIVIAKILTAITIIFSLIILASSLLQYSNNDPVRAEQHHRCALEINALRRQLRSTEVCDMEVLNRYSGTYDGIIQKYGINHLDIDFYKYKLDHPDEYYVVTVDSKRISERKERLKSELVENLLVVMGAATGFAVLSSLWSDRGAMNAMNAMMEFIRSLFSN